MVVVGVHDEDADDAEPLRIQRASSFILASLELRLDFHVDVLPVEISHYILDLFTYQGPSAPCQARNSSVITGFAFCFSRLTK